MYTKNKERPRDALVEWVGRLVHLTGTHSIGKLNLVMMMANLAHLGLVFIAVAFAIWSLLPIGRGARNLTRNPFEGTHDCYAQNAGVVRILIQLKSGDDGGIANRLLNPNATNFRGDFFLHSGFLAFGTESSSLQISP